MGNPGHTVAKVHIGSYQPGEEAVEFNNASKLAFYKRLPKLVGCFYNGPVNVCARNF